MTIRVDENKVRALMGARGIKTLEELAKRADLTTYTLRKLFRGEGFYSVTVNSLAAALRCNPLDLLTTEGDPDPHLGAPTMALETGIMAGA